MTLVVKQGDTSLIEAQALTNDGSGNWSGSLANLPVGVELTFTAHAFDSVANDVILTHPTD